MTQIVTTCFRYLVLSIASLVLFSGVAVAETPTIQLNNAFITCMKAGLGEEIFAAIQTGDEIPTEEQRTVAEECAASHQTVQTVVPLTTQTTAKPKALGKSGFSTELQSCFKKEMGAARIEAITSGNAGGTPSEDERAKVEKCFTQHGKPNFEGSEPSTEAPRFDTGQKDSNGKGMPPVMLACLKEKMGDAVFAEIQSGSRPLTAEESAKGQPCLAKYQTELHQTIVNDGDGPRAPQLADGPPKIFNPEKEACFKRILGADFEIVKATGQPVAEDKMQQAGKECFSKSEGIRYEAKSARPTAPEQPKAQLACMTEAYGADIADKMKSGNYEGIDHAVVATGKDKMGECMKRIFAKQEANPDPASYPNPDHVPMPDAAITGEQINPALMACAASLFGAEKAKKIVENSGEFAAEDKAKIEQCVTQKKDAVPAIRPSFTPFPVGQDTIAPAVSPSAPPPSGTFSKPANPCLQALFGDKFEKYQAGQYYPTPEEYTKVQSCFAQNAPTPTP